MEPVVEFCKAREKMKQHALATHAEKLESTEAKRAIMSMLQESMVRHNVECIQLPGIGKTSFVTSMSTKCDHCSAPALVREPWGLLCALCWLKRCKK